MRLLRITCLIAALFTASSASAQKAARPDHFGDAMEWALPLAAAGWAVHEHDQEGLIQLGESWATAEVAAEALKRAVHDPRPTGSGHGFASGHAASAFAAAGFLHQRYGLGVAVPAYVLATATAYSRVHTRHHYTRQVVVGAAVGLGSSALFTRELGRGQQAAFGAAPAGWAFSYSARF
ncbi:phosphatase PAP2 family protein [Ramlibacter sp. MMS24-I3-19]|uniref:phosphatase PAP2 family protein n=1 Tax=Ramlibacter sp. MMS24-I3-19 TaxID=3416606 RepID=UPI003D084E1F